MQTIQLWKKVKGNLSVKLNTGQIIKKNNEVFSAREKDIPKMFRPYFEEVLSEVEDGLEYKVIKRGKGAWYDVVDVDGTVVNPGSMRKKEAQEFADKLNNQ